ncbi:MAG: hydroxyisourate hydrolase, partial [Bacillus sp. (in: firmicutes)]
MTKMTGKITTHVLDLSMGKPASGVLVELWKVGPDNNFDFIQTSFT